MSATLYLAPTTDAVLAHIVERVHAHCRERPLAPLTCLLPSGDAVRQLRRELGNVIAVRALQFYSLSATILSEAGDDTREMNDLATRQLARGVLAWLNARGELTTFKAMLDKPGFIDVLVEWLREMKTQGIAPKQVAQYAKAGNERDRQLARVYERYQAALREGDCADADGLLWLAAEAVEGNPRLLSASGELIISGFDQFSPVQLRIVAALAQRLPVSVCLLWDSERAADSLALSRLAPTRRALTAALRPVEVVLPAVERCGPALGYLRRALFQGGAGRIADDAQRIKAVAAPDVEAEVRRALREIKRLLLDGAEEERIALLAPNPGAYRATVAAISHQYGAHVAVETTLGENPCIAGLLNVLALAPRFPWRQTFDALRSPYVRQEWLDGEQIALLDALTRERPVIEGREQWRYALTPPLPAGNDGPTDDEDRDERPLLSQVAPEMIDALRAGVFAFFDHVTPPPDASPAQFVAWMQDALLGLPSETEEEEADEPAVRSLRIAGAAEEGAWKQRDLRALHTLMRALRQWLDAQALVSELRLNPDDGTAPELRARELLDWLATVPIPSDPRQAAVRFGPLEICRAVTVDHLFVLGLGEGEFPRPPEPDPFYTSAERAGHPLPLIKTAGGEDASLWWQVLCNSQCSLTLLRSRIDANGAEWLPSAYWDAVVGLVEGLSVDQPGLSAAPTVADAACASELIEALACSAANAAPHEVAASWRAVLTARAVAEARNAWGPLSAHEGVLADAAVIGDVRGRYSPRRSWSVSRLNRFGVCPYAFWAQYALKLEAVADPAEGMDAQQRGTLIHKLLETVFARLAAERIAPDESTRERVLALFEEVGDDVLPGAAERYGFRPGPLWDREQEELRAELRAYVAWECAYPQADGFRPFLQEVKFGLPGSRYGAVEIVGWDGESISLHGVIDRIDRDANGRLRVIDYKTGSTPISARDIDDGRALQSALYAWAASLLMPDAGDVVLAAYRHTGSRKQSGPVPCDSEEGAAMVARAAARAVGFATAAREGWFAAAPSRESGGKPCGEKCDFLGYAVSRGAVSARRNATGCP